MLLITTVLTQQVPSRHNVFSKPKHALLKDNYNYQFTIAIHYRNVFKNLLGDCTGSVSIHNVQHSVYRVEISS